MYSSNLSSFLGVAEEDQSDEESGIKIDHTYEELVLSQLGSCSCCRKGDKDPEDQRNILEAQSDGVLDRHYCQLQGASELKAGDLIIVSLEDSKEISRVLSTGEMVKRKRSGQCLCGESLPLVLRKATDADLEIYGKNLRDEADAKLVFREKVRKYGLEMKLIGVHFQFDRKKLFFFYTSDGRVDFRELAKDLASVFRTRIELRQVGVRDEAKKVGGLGSCGREFCCASFLNNFKRITTQLASDQNLTTNMSKLSGPCGKLKCCLSYEVEEKE